MPDEIDNTKGNAPSQPEPGLDETVGRLLGVVLRRRWWILIPAFCVPVAVVAVAMKLPNHYVSEATLLVVQQQVSQRYVQSDSTSTVAAALQALKLEVLSARGLLQIINDLGLYSDERKRLAPELVVDTMRNDIDIQPLASADARNDLTGFTVSFAAATPQLAQEVTNRLSSLFIEENLRAQGQQATSTTKFLTDQLDAARQRLSDQEQRVQVFKSGNAGELPEQQQANLVALMDVQSGVDTITAKLVQAQQQQATLESSLGDRLTRLQSERTELLTHFTPRHPDVVKKDHEIASVQAALSRVKGGSLTPAGTSNGDSSDVSGLDTILRQAEANQAEIDLLNKQQADLKTRREQYETRLKLAPVREQQLDQILHDYNLAKQDYDELQKDKMQSQLATSLQENQEGQHFRIVEPPSLPIRPSSPKRLKISLGGVAGGLVLGLLLALLVDSKDSSFHSEKDFTQSFALPLVIGIPLVLTESERRARGWKMAIEWVVASAISLTILAAEFYVYRRG